jgi:prevent-host-death family protein
MAGYDGVSNEQVPECAMDYLAVNELSRKPGEVWRRVEAGQAVGVTRRGAPIAVVIGVGLDEADVLRAYRAARFGAAVRRLQESARASGADRLTDEEIQAEIDAVRHERRRAAGGA